MTKADPQPPNERDLRAAFKRSGLWRRGWTYARAIQDNAVRIGLQCTVLAAHRAQEQRGEKNATQLNLV